MNCDEDLVSLSGQDSLSCAWDVVRDMLVSVIIIIFITVLVPYSPINYWNVPSPNVNAKKKKNVLKYLSQWIEYCVENISQAAKEGLKKKSLWS